MNHNTKPQRKPRSPQVWLAWEKLRPDIELINTFADYVEDLAVPELSDERMTKDVCTILIDASDRIRGVVKPQ